MAQGKIHVIVVHCLLLNSARPPANDCVGSLGARLLFQRPCSEAAVPLTASSSRVSRRLRMAGLGGFLPFRFGAASAWRRTSRRGPITTLCRRLEGPLAGYSVWHSPMAGAGENARHPDRRCENLKLKISGCRTAYRRPKNVRAEGSAEVHSTAWPKGK